MTLSFGLSVVRTFCAFTARDPGSIAGGESQSLWRCMVQLKTRKDLLLF